MSKEPTPQEMRKQVMDHLNPPTTNEKIIKTFLTKMAKQNNRATAAPYFYVIRTEVEVEAPIDNCDFTKVYWDASTYESWQELEDYLDENKYTSKEKDGVFREAREYGVRKEWVQKGMFLTEEDAEEHLRLNHYHYSKNAHTYVDHAWRAPDMTRFFKALFEKFDVDQENWR